MSHHERQRRDDDERKARRATAYGTIALGLMLVLILAAGSISRFDPAALLGLSLLLCPPAGLLATRCLLTHGAEARVHAWIALILIAVIVGGQIVTILPYFAPSTWD